MPVRDKLMRSHLFELDPCGSLEDIAPEKCDTLEKETVTIEPFLSRHHIEQEALPLVYTKAPVTHVWPMGNVNAQLLQSTMRDCGLSDKREIQLLNLLTHPNFVISDIHPSHEFLKLEKRMPSLV